MGTGKDHSHTNRPRLNKLRKRLQLKSKEVNDSTGQQVHIGSKSKQSREVAKKNMRKKQQDNFNRASPMKLVRLCKKMTKEQRQLITNAGFGSLLEIKCSKLQPDLCKYLMNSFDTERCELVFPGRGSIPITEETVNRVLGIPVGTQPVIYELNSDAISFMIEQFGIENGRQPKLSEVKDKLAMSKSFDETYLRMWMTFAVSSVLAPTTGTNISPSCYPSLVDTTKISDLKWCRFVIDRLIKAAEDKLKKNIFKASMPFLMILYRLFRLKGCHSNKQR